MEKSNLKEGNTILHMAIETGNLEIFNYLLAILKIRDALI